HGTGVVVGVDPVADVLPRPVQLGADAVDQVRDLAGDELLHVLAGAVVVRAVRDRGPHAEGAHPGPHQQVAAGLRGRVGAGGVVGGGLREALRILQRQVAVDLVGGD